MRRCGITIIELVVALAIIGILAALLVPAVQSARESSRKTQCVSHLRQMGIAIDSYLAAHGMYPPGSAYGASMHVALLPIIDQPQLYQKYDFVKRDGSALQGVVVPLYVCPSDPAPQAVGRFRIAATSYAGNSGTGVLRRGYDGMFRHLEPAGMAWPNGPVRPADVRDGLSATAAVAEILHADGGMERARVNWQTPREYQRPEEFGAFKQECLGVPAEPVVFGWQGDAFARGVPWTLGDVGFTMYNHALPPDSPSCTNGGLVQEGIYSASSLHPAAVNVLFADGAVRSVAAAVDVNVWEEMGSRDGARNQITSR